MPADSVDPGRSLGPVTQGSPPPTGPLSAHDVAYGGYVLAEGPRWVSVVVYTLLRVLVLVAVWVLIQVVTPWRGLTAIAVALLISGGISLFLLDRPRGQMAIGVGSFLQRINDRIDASARAEDVDDDQDHRDGQAVGQNQVPGLLEDADQVATGSTPTNGTQGLPGQDVDDQR